MRPECPHDAHDLARLRPQLMRYALRRLRDRARAEDAVQETLLAALESLEGFAGQSSLGTWVGGILKHKIADGMRAERREAPMAHEPAEAFAEDPAQHLQRARFVRALERGLQGLPANTAHVFLLREVMGMDTAEVCSALTISAANCWVTLHRARNRLRACPDLKGLATDAELVRQHATRA